MLELNSCQKDALEVLRGIDNVFLTGVAGSGKSFLVRHFLGSKEPKEFPVLASTGAAALLLGGRTFHSFFGLGILQGGPEATVQRALGNKRLVQRLKKTRGVVIDEISMLSGTTLKVAEKIARVARGKPHPWGGLQVIAVGDFAQLPPVSPGEARRDWAFLDPVWDMSRFLPALLNTIVRTQDPEFLEVLNDVRNGELTDRAARFLESRKIEVPADFDGTRLFPRRDTVERFNLSKLETLPGEARVFHTMYMGNEKQVEDLKKLAPVPEQLVLKEGALVMLRQNEPSGKWVNGSLGHLTSISESVLEIELLTGLTVEVEQASFGLLDPEGHEVAAARNFPVNLAYATTIHKAQGMTLDRALVDLRNLWEPGHAYVALSRVRSSEGLFLAGWSPSSLRSDPQVQEFYRSLHRERVS